jgi:hypothetical protein
MDRPLANPTNRGWRKYRGPALQALAVIGAVFGVASIVLLGMWLLAPDDVEVVGEAPRPVRSSPAPPDTPGTVLIDRVHLVDVEAGAIREAQSVIVRNGVIESIGSGLPAQAGALVIDGRGKYLMPGLIDTHVHLTADQQLLLFAAAGVTTVQSLGGRVQDNLARSAAVETGALAGPAVIGCDYVAPGVSVERVEAGPGSTAPLPGRLGADADVRSVVAAGAGVRWPRGSQSRMCQLPAGSAAPEPSKPDR